MGFDTEPLYSGGRAELALDELDRMGAFDRSYLLLVCPTGTGWVDETMIESAVDAMNAMRTVPGVFKSFGHDYRGDTAQFVHTAFDLPPVAAEQMQAVEHVLRKLELDRGRRINAGQPAPERDQPRARRRTAVARWRRSLQPSYHRPSPRPARHAAR